VTYVKEVSQNLCGGTEKTTRTLNQERRPTDMSLECNAGALIKTP
jgi:hypothetical protein